MCLIMVGHVPATDIFFTSLGLGLRTTFKGIDNDSNIIFLWHEDINKERSFPKLQFFPISGLQDMHDNVHWHCSIVSLT